MEYGYWGTRVNTAVHSRLSPPRQRHRLQHDQNRPFAVALAAASGSLPTGLVAILHTDTGSTTLRMPFETAVGTVGFSPDGALLVAASQHTLRVYATT